MPWARGSPSTSRAVAAACSTCSGRAAVTSHMPSESGAPSGARRSDTPLAGLEGGLDALGGDFGHEALVLGVFERLGFVDQHDRDVVPDGVTQSQSRVVERVFIGEVVERAFVLGAGQDLEEVRVEGHQLPFTRASTSATWSAL